MLLHEHKKLTKEHYRILGLSWAGWIFDFYDLMLFSFLVIPITHELGCSEFMLSIAIGISLLATAIGGIISGALADKYGRKRVLQWTIIIYSLGTFLCGFSWSVYSLIFFRIITGLGVGGEWATGQTYISETFPANLRGKFGGLMQTGAPLGIVLASLVGGFLLPVLGWRMCFIISVIPAIIVIFIRKGLEESDLWLKDKKTHKHKSLTAEFKTLLNTQHRKLFLVSLVLCMFGMCAYWFTYTWLPEYLEVERGLSLVNSAMWIIVIQLGGFLGYLLFGFISDSIGRRPTFTLYGIIMAIGISMITVLWNVIVSNPSMILIFMFAVGFGTGYMGGYGPLFSEVFPTKIRNTGMGTVFNVSRGVQFLTPVLITIIGEYMNLSYGIFLAAFFALLCGLWIWTFPETKGRELEDLDAKYS